MFFGIARHVARRNARSIVRRSAVCRDLNTLSNLIKQSKFQDAAFERQKLLSSRLLTLQINNSIHTEGDKELSRFLKEEIAYEEENTYEEPKFKGFQLDVHNMRVSLTKEVKGERIEIFFDVNENVNVDEGIIEDEDASLEEAIQQPDITSYPTFQVKITKSSGRVLHFNCTCNNLGEDEMESEAHDTEDEQFDLFRFDSLKVYEEGKDLRDVYEAETDNLDGELYSDLMTVLLERGVTGKFVNSLVELSTALEHKKYVQFLKDLQHFASDK